MGGCEIINASPSSKKYTNTIITRRKALKENANNLGSPKYNLKNVSPKVQTKSISLQKNNKKCTVDVDIQVGCSYLNENECQTEINLKDLVICSELLGTNWLSDDTINKHISLLNDLVIKNEPVHVMNPLIVQAIKQATDFREYLEPLSVNRWNLLLMPINDSKKMLAEGGTHWSLLVYNNLNKTFFHYDSIEGKNRDNAGTVAAKILQYISGNSENLSFTEVKGPQQNNSYDCGIFMLLAIEMTVSNFFAKKDVDLGFLKQITITKKEIIQKRSTLAYILNNGYGIDKEVFSLLIASTDIGMLNNKVETNQTPQTNKWTKVKGGKLIIQENPRDAVVECTNRFSCLMEKNEDIEVEMQEESKNQKNATSKKNPKSARPVKETKLDKAASDSGAKLTIFGDSHARNCAPILQKIFNTKEAYVTGNVYSGAPLSCVYEKIKKVVLNENYMKNDVVVIVGGTNSITEEEDKIEPLLNALLSEIDHTNVVLTTIPHRYDHPQLNQRIQSLNQRIYQIAVNRKISFIPINNLLTRDHFTKHGLHLNKQGKDVVCMAIALHASLRLNSKVRGTNIQKVTRPETVPVPLQNKNSNITMDTSHSFRHFKGFSTPIRNKVESVQDLLKKLNEKPISVAEVQIKRGTDLITNPTVTDKTSDYSADQVSHQTVSPLLQPQQVIYQPQRDTEAGTTFLGDLSLFPPL